MSTTTTAATYTQLRDGSWGVRVLGTAHENQIITVRKKSGEEKQETVAKVLWTGRDSKTGQTVSLCSIGARDGQQGRRNGGGRGQYGCRDGQCYCPACSSGSECLCRCSCGFGG